MKPIHYAVVVALLGAPLFAQGDAASRAQDPASKPTSKETKKLPNPRVLMKTSMGDITLELFINETPKTVANFVGLADGTKEYTDKKTQKKQKGHYYDGLVFHRVIKGFMAQGGCPLGTGTGDPGYKFEDEINAKALGLDKELVLKGGRPNPIMLIRSQRQFSQFVVRPLCDKLGIKSQADLDKRKDEFDKALKKLTVLDVYQNMGYKYDDSRPAHAMKRGTIAMANSGPNTNGSQFFINMVDNLYLNGKHTVFGKVTKGMDVLDKMALVKMVGPGPQPSKPEKDIRIISIRSLPPAKAGEDKDKQ